MFLQPPDRTIHRWKPQGSNLLRIHAVQIGGQTSITANLVVPGVSTRTGGRYSGSVFFGALRARVFQPSSSYSGQ
jgi:hypothetical protein